MEEYVKILSSLAKEATSFEELEAVKVATGIFAMKFKKEPSLFRFKGEIEGVIYKRNLELQMILFNDRNNY